MTDDLARRIGAWLSRTGRWKEGMLAIHTGKNSQDPLPRVRVLEYDADAEIENMTCTGWQGGEKAWCDASYVGDFFVPDLSDPATWGCLLAILWERWPRAALCPHGYEPGPGYCDIYPNNDAIPDTTDVYGDVSPGIVIARALVVAYEIGEEGR